jgi:hypothetical protein
MAGVACGNGLARHPSLQLHHLLREVVRRMTVRVEQLRSAAIAAGGAPHA